MPLSPATASRTRSVMSISCVRRSLCRLSSCTGAYPSDAMAPEPLTSRELDAFRDDADRFIAELDEEYYLHLAGHKETLELEPIYERHEELTRLETARRLEGAPTELWRFACEGYLGALTREHAEKIAEVESRLETDARRRDDPLPDAPPCHVERARPRAKSPPRARPPRPARRAPEPGLPRGGSHRPRGRHEARLAELLRALQALRLRARRARAPSARRSSTRPRASGRPRATASSASASGSPWPTRDPPMSRASSAPPSSTPPTRPTGCSPHSRRRSPTSASTCARSRTSISTSSSGPERTRAPSARRSRSQGR